MIREDSLIDLAIPAFENIALCTQVGDPEWWFDTAAGLKKMARETCYLCPAFAECREENDRIETQGAQTDQRPLYGIFAGEDPHERRKRRKAECNNKPAYRGYASQCPACGRLVLDRNAVRATKDKGGKRIYACAHCFEQNNQDKDVKP